MDGMGKVKIPVYEVSLYGQKIKVTGEDIDDIMESAMTGCVYWCGHVDVVGDYLGGYASEQVSRGGSLVFYDIEDENVHEGLDRDKFLAGLQKMLETQNGCHGQMLEQRGGETYINPGMVDADAADRVIQYALFEEIVYS